MSTCNYSELLAYSRPCYMDMYILAFNYTECENTLAWEKKLSAPIPWIGLYIAAASLICFLALAADTFRGFHTKSFWFPCKFFTLNAATLTLLGIAMKLPLDLGFSGSNTVDSKLSSMVFMCVLIANFMPSLGAMADKELLMNLVALSILVITILVNIGIQFGTGALGNLSLVFVLVMISMFLLLIILSVTAFSVPTLRIILERKYGKIHKEVSRDGLEIHGMVTIEKVRENVAKYWMMGKTANPEFYITRLPTCYASGVLCFLVATAHILVLEMCLGYLRFYSPSGQYKWSTFVVLLIQSAGVIMGSIALVSRWVNATIPNFSKDVKSLREVFKVEDYRIQMLLDT